MNVPINLETFTENSFKLNGFPVSKTYHFVVNHAKQTIALVNFRDKNDVLFSDYKPSDITIDDVQYHELLTLIEAFEPLKPNFNKAEAAALQDSDELQEGLYNLYYTKARSDQKVTVDGNKVLSDLNFGNNEKNLVDTISSKVSFFHKYLNQIGAYFTNTTNETELYSFKINANSLNPVDILFLENLLYIKKQVSTGIDILRIRKSTTGVFVNTLPLVATMNIGANTNQTLNIGQRNLFFRNNKLGSAYAQAAYNDDLASLVYLEVDFDRTVDNWLHFSVQLATATNQGFLNSFQITR